MQRWLAERRDGYSLPQAPYTDPDAFEFDLQAIFHRQWLQAALEIEIPTRARRRRSRPTSFTPWHAIDPAFLDTRSRPV